MNKKWKIILFIMGMIIGIVMILLGIIAVDDLPLIRLEGSEL